MKKKLNSYGKTWHVWNTGHHGMADATKMPTGEPKLAWSFNHDGEALPGLEKKTEDKFDISFKKKREHRKDLVSAARPQRGVDVLNKHYAGDIRPIEGVKDSQQAQEKRSQGPGKGPVIKE